MKKSSAHYENKSKLAMIKKIDVVKLIKLIKEERNDARSTLRSFKINPSKKKVLDDAPIYNYFRGRVDAYNSVFEFLGYRKPVIFKKGRKPGKKRVKKTLQELDMRINTFNLKKATEKNIWYLMFRWLNFSTLTFRFVDELFNEKQRYYIKRLRSIFLGIEENCLIKHEKFKEEDLEKLKKLILKMREFYNQA